MNQSELAAYILTRERIVNQIDAIETQGGSKDTLKRLRRFGNAFSWYPEFYPEILDGIGGMSDKQLMSALRTEDGFMKLIAPVKGLPIHHVFASRTGGDLPLRTPADVFLEVRQRTFDRYGFGAGPHPLNLGAHSAFDNRMHMQRWGNKGTAFSQERGLGMAPEDYTGPVLHSKQTKDIGTKLGQDPALLRSQSSEIFEALVPYLDNQYEAFNAVTDYPLTRQQRAVIETNVDPDAFATGRTTAQSQAVAKAVQEKGLDVEFAKKLDFSGATVNFTNRLIEIAKTPGVRRVAAAVPIAGTFLGAANVEASAAEREQEIIENPDDPTLPVSKTLDQIAGWGDRTALAGYAATATGGGAPVGIPMVAAGETASFFAGTGSLIMDSGRAIFKWATNPDNQPDEEERSALSFSSGAFK